MSKKQDCTAMSSAEAKYVALSASCPQIMWMRTQLQDYGFNYNKIPLYCYSQSAIVISCNPVQHSRTKHIHTRYHFIKEQVENGIIKLYFVITEYQLADMFTKALSEDRFQYLVTRIGMRCLTPAELEIVTNRFTHIVLSALRRSDIENKLAWLDLMEPEDSYKDGDGDTSFQLKSDSLPHAHAQTTKTYYKHQDSRIMKTQELKTKTSTNSDIQDLPSRYQDYQDNDCQGRLLASFQDDAKYEHVGQDTRSDFPKSSLEEEDNSRQTLDDMKNLQKGHGDKKEYRRREKFVHQPYEDKKNFRKIKEDKKEKDDRRCFKCGDPNHFICDCSKHSFNDQKAFVVGCWSDNGDDCKKEEICLMALNNNVVLSDTPYYSSSSLDNESWENEYDKLCKISLRIIIKNKQLKAKNEVLKREACELKTKVEQLERNKEISLKCESCVDLQSKVSSLTLKLASFKNSSSSLQEMLEIQKPQKDKHGLGYKEVIASSSSTKTKKLSHENVKMPSVEPASPVPSAREQASSDKPNRLFAENTGNEIFLRNNILKKIDSVLITRKPILNISKNVKQPPILKLRQGLGKGKIQTHPKPLHRKSNTLYPKRNYHQVD
ncbi:retrovirus-related pol polyprotein from transposon TNT 1-94 [Tanacetum coccineum]|uniref:Retrovirus-related pol polyprotein from transposon TNT 1-94 n=1 Tax=Tanacetum coccineum TaxID=301880 RepID=A0ABQ5H1M3_9ASTR